MREYEQVFKSFEENADAKRAGEMSAYMRGQFPYLGIPTPKRKELSKEFFRAKKKEPNVDWDFVFACWKKPEREFQYLAINYLEAVRDKLSAEDISALRTLATEKSWWDTVDGLDMLAGHIAQRFPEVNGILLEWSTDENIWLRRIAIDHQLTRKDKTDAALLEAVIKNNFGQTEIFINKAIGWSLREYSKTNPEWVRNFLSAYKAELAPLSIREASKYV